MGSLRDRVALVTGASRGVGKGVALGLGEAGATVYVTGRTVAPGTGPMGLPGTVGETAEEVTRLGGTGIPVRCDHTDDRQVEALFDQIDREQGKLDVLVNSVWGGYENMVEGNRFTWPDPFWAQPVWRWDAMFTAGVRAHYVASQTGRQAYGQARVRADSQHLLLGGLRRRSATWPTGSPRRRPIG